MTTGFMIRNALTKQYTVDYAKLKLIDMGLVDEAKFYLKETGKYKGTVWNIPITLGNITYIFDEQGRVIDEIRNNPPQQDPASSSDLDADGLTREYADNDTGFWEYEPEDDTWMYAELDEDKNKHYIKGTAYPIKTLGNVLYYIFDKNGKMLTGFTEYNNNIYYLHEKGDLKGSVYTGSLIYSDVFYNFDKKSGVLVASMTLTQAMALTETDAEFAALVVDAMTLSED